LPALGYPFPLLALFDGTAGPLSLRAWSFFFCLFCVPSDLVSHVTTGLKTLPLFFFPPFLPFFDEGPQLAAVSSLCGFSQPEGRFSASSFSLRDELFVPPLPLRF